MRRARTAGTLCAAVVMLVEIVADARAVAACVGDCDGDAAVTITELIVGVNLALGAAPSRPCTAFDADHNGTVTINELITAVNNALSGCGFQPPVGVSLAGTPGRPAVDATVDMPPVPVDDSEVEDGVILTRLDLHLAPGATVGQVNAALERVNGGVVSMLRGLPTLTIAIPRPADLDELSATVQTLRAAAGISWTAIAHEADPKLMPPSPAGEQLDQLGPHLPARLPAAWNASHLATTGCAGRKVRVLVADSFQRPPLLGPYANFFDEIPQSIFRLIGGPGPQTNTHGYDVTTTLAAMFDTANPTGANPFTQCLEIDAIQVSGLTGLQRTQELLLAFPAGKFVLNFSQGYKDRLSANLIAACTTDGCTEQEVEKEMDLPLARAYDAANWIRLTASRWDDFLVAVAAGNERDKPGTAVYAGLGVAAMDAGMNVATLLPNDGFLMDGALWNAGPGSPGFPNLTVGGADVERFEQDLAASGIGAPGSPDNILIVGSMTPGRTSDELFESEFSDSYSSPAAADGPHVLAVGEQVFELDGFARGTSLAAPQVAGLASYLWLLSPDLESQPASVTRDAIAANIRDRGVIDAYASALSLDRAVLPAPGTADVRLAILDENDDGAFNDADLAEFIKRLLAGNKTQDYGRYDLNGDGFTGGPATERFDLDRVGSTQFGTTHYTTVTQSIEGEDVDFDEKKLTDLQILCYYAYSKLYTGDTDARHEIAADHCGISVTIVPETVTLPAGGTQEFGATVHGSDDPRVTWVVVSGDGTISDTGLLTAGPSGGTVIVRAVSVAAPDVFADATVTVSGGSVVTFVSITAGIPPGMITGHVNRSDGEPSTFVEPIGNAALVVSAVNAALAGAGAVGNVSVFLQEPAAVSLSIGASVGLVNVSATGAGCDSSVTVSVGDVRKNNVAGVFSAGDVTVGGCLRQATINAGNVEDSVFIAGSNIKAKVSAGAVGRAVIIGSTFGASSGLSVDISTGGYGALGITNTSGTSVSVTGSIQRMGEGRVSIVGISGNSNLTLGAVQGGVLNNFAIQSTSFTAAPTIVIGNIEHPGGDTVLPDGSVEIVSNSGLSLGSISMGDIDGNLKITANRGFSNADAGNFAEARTVGGATTISGNAP